MTTDEEKKAQEKLQVEREEKEKAAKETQDLAKKTVDPASGTEGGEAQKSPLEEARDLDKSIKASNVEMKKLLDKQEKMLADSQIAGKGFAAKPEGTQFTEKEKASRARIKTVGDSGGSAWAKKYA